MQSSRGHDGQRGVTVRVAHAPTPESVAARLRAAIPSLGHPLSDAQQQAVDAPDPWPTESS